jgi:uncharacterized protein
MFMLRQGMKHPGDKLGKIVIDSLDFARSERRMSGVVAVRDLQRLTDVLADDEGDLAWFVRGEFAAGEFGGGRKPFLVIEVSGELHLICQRCLGALPFRVNVESRLLLVPPGKPWPDEDLQDDLADPVEALAEQPLLPLIEDELLLALPISPRHASCKVPGHDDGKAAASPFATLAQLKKLN